MNKYGLKICHLKILNCVSFLFNVPSKNAGFFRGVHSKCIPGTDKEVMIIVMHRRRKTVPERAKNRRNNIKRCLWKTSTVSHTKHNTVPVNSHI